MEQAACCSSDFNPAAPKSGVSAVFVMQMHSCRKLIEKPACEIYERAQAGPSAPVKSLWEPPTAAHSIQHTAHVPCRMNNAV